MAFTKYAIQAMGYTEFPNDNKLEIEFATIKIFSIKGINIRTDSEISNSEPIAFGNCCKVVVSNSVNEASKLLSGQEFTLESEQNWLKTHNASPPFVLIYFKESESRILNGGLRQEKDGILFLYDAFPAQKTELKSWEEQSLPSIVVSLTAYFSSDNSPAILAPIENCTFGLTKESQTVINTKLSLDANVTFSSGKPIEEINSNLEYARSLYASLTKETSRHIFSALNETDKLKQFIYYFLFIERYTHNQYKEIATQKTFEDIFNTPDRLKISGLNFTESQFQLAKDLTQRFYWCAILKWDQITDEDVACFLKLKSLRNKLSHGEDINEGQLPVEKIRALSFKLLATENNSSCSTA